MADLIQNVQEVYKKWESKSNPSRGRTRNVQSNLFSGRKQHSKTDTLSNFSRSLQQRNFRRAPHSSTRKYESLAQFKMSPSVMPHQKLRPFVGMPCTKCFPHSKALIQDKSIYLLGVNNMLHIPYFSLQSLNIGCFWNLFKIHSTLPDACVLDILKSERVKVAFEEILTSENSGEDPVTTLDALHERAKNILKNLKSSISLFCVEITGLVVHYYLKKIFNGILVNKGQIEIMKTLSKENIPFVYLPLYRSYFDYILVPYILHMNSLNLPFVTVNNIFIPILRCIFQFLGTIFIKRHVIVGKSGTDPLSDAVVKSYIVNCLQAGHNIQLFLEDKRSITGKPHIPYTNLLSAIMDSIDEGLVEDVYIVPVSIIYEITEENLAAKQLGSKEESGIFSKLFFLWKILHLHCGYARVNFIQPFSVKEFLDIYQKQSKQNCHPQFGLFGQKNEESGKGKSTVMDLALHAFYDATLCTSLMSTHLLAFLLVTQYRKGGTQQQLQISMDWLRSEIQRKKCDLGFTGESLPVIKRAVELLGKDLITIETIEMEWTSSDLENNNVKIKVYTPVVKLPHVLELQYYANAVVPIFLKESILVNALYALFDVDICHFHHCDSRFFVPRDELIQTAIRLSEILKFDFIIILPCQDIVSAFNDTIDALIEKECLSGAGAMEGLMKSKKQSLALSFDLNSSDEEDYAETTSQQLRIDLREESIIHLEFLRSVLSPYIESYWLAACSLLGLIDEVKEESIFIQEMQMTAKEKLYKGLLAYEESFSAETLKNALKMFADRHILEYHDEDRVRTLCLSEPFNSFESITEIITDIEDFRK